MMRSHSARTVVIVNFRMLYFPVSTRHFSLKFKNFKQKIQSNLKQNISLSKKPVLKIRPKVLLNRKIDMRQAFFNELINFTKTLLLKYQVINSAFHKLI